MANKKAAKKTNPSAPARKSISDARKQIDNMLSHSVADVLESQRMAQQLIEALPNPIFFKGINGRYIGVNKAWERFFGTSREEFVGKSVHDLYPNDPDIAQRLHADDQALWDNPGTKAYETTITTPDGKKHEAIYYKATFTDGAGAVAGLIGTIIDITERKEFEQLYRSIFELAPVGIARTSLEGKYLQVNQGFAEMMGCSMEELLTMSSQDFMHPDEAIRMREIRDTLLSGSLTNMSGERRFVRKDGLEIWANRTLSVVRDHAGQPLYIIAVIEDITERKNAEVRILQLAHYDELTGLANRNMVNKIFSQALARSRRNGKPLAILFIDLDRFKNVNDTLGHGAGDKVLKEVAERLRRCLRDSDTLGRLGGDEFVVLLEEMPQATHSAVAAQKIIDALTPPFILDTQEFHITASIGISTYPADSEDVPGLLKNADIAMYRAKDLGKNNYQFYSSQMNIHTLDSLSLESNLRHALERQEFILHYQPKINIRSGRIVGMEALVRWQHPTNGLIPPMQFIPLAEETGLIVPIGEWVLRAACAQNASWRKQGLPPLCVAVNLSARQFRHEHLLQNVGKVLHDTGLDSSGLELEITESMVVQDPERAVLLLDSLRAMGISISIDDFGTGYSSLSYLKRFPIDSLKIDRSFIKDLPLDTDDAAIAQAIIAMAHSLKISVIAEGVETEEQLRFLRNHLCDEGQGYYFSKPVTEHEFVDLVLKNAAPDNK